MTLPSLMIWLLAFLWLVKHRNRMSCSKMQPATLSTSELERVSDKSKKALRFMTRSCGDSDMDYKLWQRTLIGWAHWIGRCYHPLLQYPDDFLSYSRKKLDR